MSDIKIRNKLCLDCKQAIEDIDNSVQVLGRLWHPNHFVCKDCNKDLKETIFFVHDGVLHCESCQRSNYGKTCETCRKPILEDEFLVLVVGFLKREWHFECVKCIKCNKGIHQKVHHITDSGDVICDLCFRKR